MIVVVADTSPLNFGVPVLDAASPEESAEIMVTAARQLGRTTSLLNVRPGYRPARRHRRSLFILQGLPGVGPARAKTLLQAFGSVSATIAADPDRLAKVEGIGPTVAASIRKAVDPEPAPASSTLVPYAGLADEWHGGRRTGRPA